MHTRTIVRAVALAGCFLVVGCQIIAQINGLHVGTGGAAGAGGMVGAGATEGGGMAQCTPACGTDEFCAADLATPTCMPCGIPDGGSCQPGQLGMACPSCDGPLCTLPCCPPMGASVEAKQGPTQIICNDPSSSSSSSSSAPMPPSTCNQASITCAGGYLCEVICYNDACQGLTLICADDGPCRLTCHDTSCEGATVLCGSNECDLVCDAANRNAVTSRPGPKGASCRMSSSCKP
jgi:hypothetical protein